MAAVGLHEIVAALGGELIGEPAALEAAAIARIGAFDDADASSIAFLADRRLVARLADCQAACVIVAPALRDAALARGAAIVTPDPYLYYARLSQWWVTRRQAPVPAAIHPTAVIDPTARIAADASIGALCVIEAEAEIGAGAVIGAQCYVGRSARIGAGTRLHAKVNFGEGCVIGTRGTLHGGVVIGADGFGFAPTPEGRWEKIEQLGAVRIGDDVDIGANSCVDRGALGDTVIGNGVKLDNLIQIGHNVRIGEHTAVAGCVGIAGSTVVGKHVMIGGAAMIGGHLEIADHVFISGAAVVSHSVMKAGRYSGNFPLDDNAAWQKNAAVVRNLASLRERVRALEKTKTTPTGAAATNNNDDTGSA
ncbi:MAG: UDP-3-O-(3-hydroxymyristoyl)glucosamine N-acyltransferase [Pseudomonadota bacterium]|nr:UDP-3-O-(3-hydroxymyristoyl)glucosamine N-acyltransferase [Pseudomonadota bacterium]